MPKLRNGNNGDSNPGSLDCESGILPTELPRSTSTTTLEEVLPFADTVSVDRLRPFYEDKTDNRELVTDVVDPGKSDIIDDHVDDLVVRRSNRTVSPPIRFGDSV